MAAIRAMTALGFKAADTGCGISEEKHMQRAICYFLEYKESAVLLHEKGSRGKACCRFRFRLTAARLPKLVTG